MTIFFAFIGLLVIPDFPETSKSISPLERRLVEKRHEEDNGTTDEGRALYPEHANGFILAVKDWKVWWFGATSAIMAISTSYSAFFPTICKTMGFDVTTTLLLCAPPWVLAGISNFIITRYVLICINCRSRYTNSSSRHSDKSNDRFFHLAFMQSVGVVGFVTSMSTMNTPARYTSL